MRPYQSTPPFEQDIYDRVVAQLKPQEDVIAFVKDFLIALEADRHNITGSPAKVRQPQMGPERYPAAEPEIFRLVYAYRDAYKAAHPPTLAPPHAPAPLSRARFSSRHRSADVRAILPPAPQNLGRNRWETLHGARQTNIR